MPKLTQRLIPYNATGRQGAIKTMILGGLQAFYDQKQRVPEIGKAFNQFLRFLYLQFNQPTKPVYFKHISRVEEECTTKKSDCIRIKGEKKSKPRKYIETQFYTFRKEFTPEMPPDVTEHP